MAVAKILCGACGGSLSMLDRVCPKCGEPVELLSGEPGESPGGVPAAAESRSRRSAGGKSGGRTGGVQRWQLVAGVVVVVLLALFVTLEFSRPGVSPTPGGAAAPMGGGAPAMEQLAHAEQAVEASPSDPGALIALANTLHDIGMSAKAHLPRAVDTYRRYLALRPNDPNARVDMGICYFEMARSDSMHSAAHLDEAIREMTAAFRIDTLHQPAAFNLGVVNLFAANTAESVRWFTKAIAIAPGTDLGKRARGLLDQHAFPAPSP